ncbi:MAG: hypothetical protein PVI06_05475 [Desulfobacterales bacterium]|jgi:hypothetical protein
MMDKDKLRKADVYSGAVIFLFGLWIVSQAFKMPMKDSWGGVQNVWYVSPALFPLFVGCMIMLMGALLARTALKRVGSKEFKNTVRWLLSKALFQFLNSVSNLRFYTIAVLFLSLVYLNIPRIDFFISAFLFLVVFITSFYFDDAVLLKKLFFFYLAGVVFFMIFFMLGLSAPLSQVLPFAADILMICFIAAYCGYAWMLIRNSDLLRKKYRTAMIVAIVTPFLVGIIFKYFLLVPMPAEGLVVAFLDYIWYLEF